jgi:hypothetical protein
MQDRSDIVAFASNRRNRMLTADSRQAGVGGPGLVRDHSLLLLTNSLPPGRQRSACRRGIPSGPRARRERQSGRTGYERLPRPRMGRWRPGRGVDEETLAVEEGEMAGEGDEGRRRQQPQRIFDLGTGTRSQNTVDTEIIRATGRGALVGPTS